MTIISDKLDMYKQGADAIKAKSILNSHYEFTLQIIEQIQTLKNTGEFDLITDEVKTVLQEYYVSHVKSVELAVNANESFQELFEWPNYTP